MSDLFQWAIIAFVVLSIAVHVWKGGAANPQSTGKVARDVSGLSAKLSELSGRVGQVETEVNELKEEAATTEDVKQLERLVDEKFATMNARMDGHHALSQATNNSVDRIERILIERSLNK